MYRIFLPGRNFDFALLQPTRPAYLPNMHLPEVQRQVEVGQAAGASRIHLLIGRGFFQQRQELPPRKGLLH